MTSALEKYRDDVRRASPPWLQRGNAEKYLYALGLMLDIFGDALIAAVRHRFPGVYSNESLGLIGRERRISRGRLETDASYAARLQRWLEDHRRRGNPYAMLLQLYWHYAPVTFTIDLVYRSGRRFRLNSDAIGAGVPPEIAIERDTITWEPDDEPERWARWWLMLRTDQWAFTPPDDDELADIRLVPREWNAAHALGYIVLMPTDGDLWDYPPEVPWDTTGTWDGTGTPVFLTIDDE